jgi:hypothetical protein
LRVVFKQISLGSTNFTRKFLKFFTIAVCKSKLNNTTISKPSNSKLLILKEIASKNFLSTSAIGNFFDKKDRCSIR